MSLLVSTMKQSTYVEGHSSQQIEVNSQLKEYFAKLKCYCPTTLFQVLHEELRDFLNML